MPGLTEIHQTLSLLINPIVLEHDFSGLSCRSKSWSLSNIEHHSHPHHHYHHYQSSPSSSLSCWSWPSPAWEAWLPRARSSLQRSRWRDAAARFWRYVCTHIVQCKLYNDVHCTALCVLFFSFAVTNIFVFQVTMFAFSLMVRLELARAIPWWARWESSVEKIKEILAWKRDIRGNWNGKVLGWTRWWSLNCTQGEGEQSGIIPRLCKDLFVRIDKDSDSEFSVEVKQCSFFRIRDCWGCS